MLDLNELIAMLETDTQASLKALAEYKEAKAYYHGHQLKPQELAKLESRGQVPIYENIYKMICDKILGYKIQSIQEIKVSGRQEVDKPLANVLTDLLRVFNQQAGYEKEIYKRDFELLMGCSVVELWVEQDKAKNYHITVKTLPTESFLIDAYSQDKNALDATRFHKKQNISAAHAKALFKDTPIFISRNDTSDKRAFIYETWVKEYDKENPSIHTWNRYLWNPQGGIYKKEISPFKNGAHPFIVAKYNTDEDFNWYGIFRDIKPIQDYINFAEIKMGNMIGTIKALYEFDAVDDVDEFVEGVSKDNAVVGVRSGSLRENKIQFIQHHGDIAALTQKSEQKKNMAKILSGLNDEALAMATNRQSGIAIAQRRESGLLGLQYYVNSADNADRLLYEKVLDFMQCYFTKEQVFRITDKRRGDRYFSINTSAENSINIGTFDLVYKTQLKNIGREERFAHWSEIFKTISSVRPDLVTHILPLMLKDTDSQIIDDIEEILENVDKQAQEQAQAAQPIQEQSAQLEIARLQAQINKLEAEAAKLRAQSQVMQEVGKQMENPPPPSAQGADNKQGDNIPSAAKKAMQISKVDMR